MNDNTRHNYLDWLRLLAVLLGLVYHAGRAFDLEPWHVKALDTSKLVQMFNSALATFRLPLLFFVSGAGTLLALGKRSGGQYGLDRFKRLLAPLLFGMVVLIPPQIYLERISTQMPGRLVPVDFQGSYLEFLVWSWQHLGLYPDGCGISWHHLWFLFYLLMFSLMALPMFLWLRRRHGKAALDLVGKALAGGRVWLAVLPFAITTLIFPKSFDSNNAFIGDFDAALHFGLLFIWGFVAFSQTTIPLAMESQRRLALLVAFSTIALRAVVLEGFPWVWVGSPEQPLFLLGNALRVLGEFSAIVAAIGYSRRYLNRPSRFLSHARYWVYPFYIWHQTVIVVLGYFLLKLALPTVGAYPVLMLLSLGVTVLLSVAVQHFWLTRFLFGVQPSQKPTQHKPKLGVPGASGSD